MGWPRLRAVDRASASRAVSWVLENAGYKVVVPAWWTPTGRRRAKLRLRGSGSSASLSSGSTPGTSRFAIKQLLQYRYALSIGYLEQLGMNGCLADDMGLGKTMQVIAQLVRERADASKPSPTLLIAPTSVLGNWQRVVLGEAQNIKNPKAAQTKAVCKLPAVHRLALTGTPVENRLSDLWSLFQSMTG